MSQPGLGIEGATQVSSLDQEWNQSLFDVPANALTTEHTGQVGFLTFDFIVISNVVIWF